MLATGLLYIVLHLHTGGLQCSHFYYEGMVCVVYDDVHSGKANHLVQLIASFVDNPVAGHEGAHLYSFFLYAAWELAAQIRYCIRRHIRVDFLRYEQHFFNVHS